MTKIGHFIGVRVDFFEFFIGGFDDFIKVDNFKFFELSRVGILNNFVDFS